MALLAASPAAAQRTEQWICTLPDASEPRIVEIRYSGEGAYPCTVWDWGHSSGQPYQGGHVNTPGCPNILSGSVLPPIVPPYQCTGPAVFAGIGPSDGPLMRGTAYAGVFGSSPSALSEQWLVTDAVRRPPRRLMEDGAHFAVVSTHLMEQDAHHAEAEIRRRHPLLRTAVFPPREHADYWSVMLAAYTTKSEAKEMVEIARREGLGVNPYHWTFERPLPDARSRWAATPPQWQRTVVQACYEDGVRDSLGMAACTGLVLTPETFVSCMAGSTCLPAAMDPDELARMAKVGLPELEDGWDAAYNYVMPMIAVREQAESCMQRAEAVEEDLLERTFVDCMSRKMMTTEQEWVYDCLAKDGDGRCLTELPFFSGRFVAGSQCLHEAQDDDVKVACLTEHMLDEREREALRCVSEHDSEAGFAGCVGEGLVFSALPDDMRDLGRCVYDAEDSGAEGYRSLAGCALKALLPTRQAEIVSCGLQSQSLVGAGLCAAAPFLSPEQKIAAECAVTAGVGTPAFWMCSGGRLTARELDKCLQHGIGTKKGCFGPNNTLVVVFQGIGDAAEEIGSGLGRAFMDVADQSAGAIDSIFRAVLARDAREIRRKAGPMNPIVERLDQAFPIGRVVAW